MADLTDEQILEWVTASRLAQGLPMRIEDPAVLRDVALLSEPKPAAA